jgi:hypothetical protein
MPRLILYPFRYRSEITGKWVRARYVAERDEIAARHAPGEWEIIGPPEIRDVDPNARHFNPFRMIAHAELKRLQEQPPQINPHLEQPPAIDVAERLLVALFLRRYVTYCAKRRHFKQMQGAAALYREVARRWRDDVGRESA